MLARELVDAAGAVGGLLELGLRPMDHPAAVTAEIGVLRDLPVAFWVEHGFTP